MFYYSFMVHAFEAGTIVSIVAGVIGYFVVLRRSAFAAHALSHIGFAGAAGAVVVNLFFPWVTPLYGLLAFTTGGAAAMAGLGKRASQRDMSIGITLAFMLGLGSLFITLYGIYGQGYSEEAYSILFGDILGITTLNVVITLLAGIALLLLTSFIYRPLLFSSLDQEVAEAKGMSTLTLGLVFMLLVAVAVSIAVQFVGVLLIFSLLVTPAAVAQQVSTRPARAILTAIIVAIVATWLGLFMSWYINFPVSFFITSLTFGAYLISRYVYPKIRPSSMLRRNAQQSEELTEHAHETSKEIPIIPEQTS
jgi:zinc/manganese transport system permease protein